MEGEEKFFLSKGMSSIRVEIENYKSDIESWTDNPIGISAVLVPPPCPRKVSGRGVVTRIIVDDPGNGFPVTEGHVLFVPNEENWQCLTKCFEAAYKWGYDWIERGYCDAFNIGQNVGEAAGQTVMYPHVHLIPRRNGDMKDPRGGVRHVIPSKGKYTESRKKERE